jgi:UDP-N-acetylglucosamine transferase subunit ALG13
MDSPGRILLVASAGGHLKQLQRLRPRLPLDGEVVWATFDTPQSRSMLAGEEVVYVGYQGARDLPGLARNLRVGLRVIRSYRPDVIVSTGSQVALAFMIPARAHGIACHFIESAARSTGPSLTARIARRLPGVTMYTQYPHNTRWPWRYGGSVFEGFAAEPGPPVEPVRVVVTAGTFEGYGFGRLFERLIQVLPDSAEVLWQVGDTDVSRLGIEGRRSMPALELEQAILAADVVVAHAGVGSALASLEAGKLPILVPRRQEHGEHVDDHQVQIADELASRGLALHRSVEGLTWDDLVAAAGRRIVATDRPPPFRLAGIAPARLTRQPVEAG